MTTSSQVSPTRTVLEYVYRHHRPLPVEDQIVEWRRAKMSWPVITNLVNNDFGIQLSTQTVKNWWQHHDPTS